MARAREDRLYGDKEVDDKVKDEPAPKKAATVKREADRGDGDPGIHSRHLGEHSHLHAKHQGEHAHLHAKHMVEMAGDTVDEEMHARHEGEIKDMHRRHLGELRDMNARHEKEGGAVADPEREVKDA